ncbi:hypothetical protein HDU76_012459 [Blyttiomyces sp. JEL0837]|nr:hypothetical protein HDU76_012459 [Blyttiomyces sp. JEL0837]
MAERKAQNKYYPPDWDPSKGSINKYVGQHPLRDRARKLDKGILIIRFEMPYSIWCEGCNNHIGKGVRYNAEKKKAGMYYSTPIWNFRMKCHLCDSYIEIETDPKNAEYVIKSGARQRVETFDAADAETMDLGPKEESTAGGTKEVNPMLLLERQNEDVAKAKQAAPSISRLQEHNDKYWKDPFAASQRLRKQFREEKKVMDASKREAEAFRDRHSLLLPILPATEEDGVVASRVFTQREEAQLKDRDKHVMDKIMKSSIFKPTSSSKSVNVKGKIVGQKIIPKVNNGNSNNNSRSSIKKPPRSDPIPSSTLAASTSTTTASTSLRPPPSSQTTSSLTLVADYESD